MSQKAFLIDTSKCIGCKSCQAACKMANFLPAEESSPVRDYTFPDRLSAVTWTRILFAADKKDMVQIQQRCNQCSEPQCLAVCPEKAIYKYAGWTLVDEDRCIGCGTCEQSCPYSAIHVLKDKREGMKSKKAYKCHACVPTGREPSCVAACPTGAISYGNRLRMIKRGRKIADRLSKKNPDASLFGLDDHGGLNVLTVLTVKPDDKSLSQNMIDYDLSRMIYSTFKKFTFGLADLKRRVWDISMKLSGNDRGKGA